MNVESRITKYLNELGLSQTEAARFLSVNPRTVRRWAQNPKETPGPVIQAFEAWVKLERRGVPWKPDELRLNDICVPETTDQINRQRDYTIELESILSAVENRGGPITPWKVDLKKNEAKLGNAIYLTFDRLHNGGFVLNSYRRTDREPDLNRDRSLIEDAYACIARAISKSRQTK